MLLGSNNFRPVWVVVTSLLVAGGLNIFPTGWFGGYFQPDWVALVLIYWCLWEPERIGAGVGWLSGLFLDILDFGIMGKHALAKCVCGFLASRVSLRLRVYPTWQQCIGVAVLISIDTLIEALVLVLLDRPGLSIGHWLSPGASMLMWPVVLVILHRRSNTHSWG